MSKDKENINTVNELDSCSIERAVAENEATDKSVEVEGLKQALAAKVEETQAIQDKHLRLAAEFENYKRLAQKDQREYSRFANENILKELLSIVDNLERAITASKNAPKEGQKSDSLVQGVELTLKQFIDLLTKFGVRPIASVGEPFDPARHQAVARVESATAQDNTVVEEFQKGYLLHERILRAAMVTVASASAGNQEPASTGTA